VGVRTVNPGEAERMLKSFRTELEGLERRATALRKLVAGFEEYLALSEDADPALVSSLSPEPESGSSYPRGREAILAVLADRGPGDWSSIQDITDELTRRGWHPDSDNPADAVRAAVKRATDAGELQRIRHDGRTYLYRLARREAVALPNDPATQANMEVDSP
jgi:hypothetical protein